MNTKTIYILGIAILATIVGFTFLSGSRSNLPPVLPVTSEEQLPNLTLKDYSGEEVLLSSFLGKPLIVNAWAAWCPFCKKELVDFVTLQKELGDKVVVIAIDRAESMEVAKRYSDELGATGSLIFLLDPEDSFYSAIGGFSMPETIFVDKNGVVKLHKRGPMDLGEMREKAKAIL